MNVFSEFWSEIASRPSGPMALRFYVQPIMASVFAIRDGRRDARDGNSAYLWSLFTDPAHRSERLRSGWHSIGKIFLLSIALDVVYQFVVFKGLRPLQGVVVATLLAVVPYILFRGPVNRLSTPRRSRGTPTPPIAGKPLRSRKPHVPRIVERRSKTR